MKNKYTYLFIAIISSIYINAQTGPGGVGDNSNNMLWLKSETIGLADGTLISSWADQTTNTNDVSQPTSTLQPYYMDNATDNLNGFPIVRFSQENGRIRKTNFNNFPSTEITAIYVNKNNLETNDAVFSYASSTSLNNDFLVFNSNNLSTFISNSSKTSGLATNDDTWHIVNTSWESSAGNLEIWKDGLNSFTSTHATGSSITSGGCLAIAGEQDSVDGSYSSAQAHFGDFSEVIIYNTFLNKAQQIIVSNYLGAKYNINISNDYYAHQATHYYDVAGIGREDVSNIHTTAMSANLLQLENPSALDTDKEYLLFGHDNADSTTWTSTEVPNVDTNTQRIAREWHVDETGELGNVDYVIDTANLPALPAGYTVYALMVDSDGDFTSGASVYEMTLQAGTKYVLNGFNINSGDYISIAAVKPSIAFTTTTDIGFETSDATIEISLNYISLTSHTVDYNTSDGTATQPSDYTTASGTATIIAGSQTTTITVSIINDMTIENNETLDCTLSNPSAGITIGTNNTHTYTIQDDDNPRKIYFNTATSSNDEGTTSVNIRVTINNVDNINDTTVDYSVSGGTATGGGIDYTLTSGTATITAGNTWIDINFTVVDDTIYELDETIAISLSNPINCNLSTTEPTVHTYTITNNDTAPTIQFNGVSSAGLESIATVDYTVILDVISDVDATVDYTVSGTASNGTDYNTLIDGTYTITAGNTSASITANIIDDLDLELDETIIITISNPTNCILGTNVSYTYTIINDDFIGYTGPGGVGDASTNVFWLDANEIIGLNDGDDISSWLDKSGNTNDATQTDVLYQPIFKTNILNSFPVVRFNKVNGRLIKNNFTDFPTTDITAIYVNNNGETGDGVLSYATTTSNNHFLLYNSANLYLFRDSSIGTGVSVNDSNWHIVNTSWKGSNGDVEIWKDGSKDFSQTNFKQNTSLTPGGCLAIAAEQDSVDGSYAPTQDHIGDFPEIIIYNRYLNTAQQIIVSNYLSAKYNIAILASNDIYAQDNTGNGDFDFNVCGIGQATDASFHTDSKGRGLIRIKDPSTLVNDSYLFWGEETKNPIYDFTTIDATISRLNSKWRVSKRNDLGTVSVSFNETDIISNAIQCGKFEFVVSNSNTFTTKTVYPLTLTAGVYTATNVSFADGDYFTIEYKQNPIATWNGAWDIAPTITNKAIINQNYDMNTEANITACSCELTSGNTINIPSGKFLEVQYNIINNGAITVEHGGSIVQKDETNTNTGANYTIKKTANQSAASDVTYFSTPTVGTTIDDMVPSTTYRYDFNASAQAWNGLPGSSIMSVARGYILRNPTVAGDYTVTFTGKIYNGTINSPIVINGTGALDDDDWNLIGNPYPSVIDADKFFITNASSIVNAVYYWKHLTPLNVGGTDYDVNGYAIWNGTGAVNGGSQYIPSGQGFFVEAKVNGNVVFKNEDRVTLNNTTFYRIADNSNRIWLNLLDNNNTTTTQQLIGFFPEATDSKDNLYDAHLLGSGLIFYSILNSEKFSILANDANYEGEIIPLGYQCTHDGQYTITIDHTTGTIAEAGNYIYLRDNELNTVHDLTDSDYTFTSVSGEFNDRFELFTTQTALAVDEVYTSNDKLIVLQNQDTFSLRTAENQEIIKITVYDVLGRQLLKVNGAEFNLALNKGIILLLNVSLENGTKLSKKVIKM